MTELCTACGLPSDGRRMMRLVPAGHKLPRGIRLCVTCVHDQIADFRSHNCEVCDKAADMLERGLKALGRYDDTGTPQAVDVVPSGTELIHKPGCPLRES